VDSQGIYLYIERCPREKGDRSFDIWGEEMYVKTWMTGDPITVERYTSIFDAQEIMRENNIKHLPVLEGRRIVGIVSRSDLLEASPSDATTLSVHELHYLLSQMKVGEIMTEHPFNVTPDTPIEIAAMNMRNYKVASLPVVDPETGGLVGIITESDIFGALIEIMGVGEGGTRLSLDLEHKPGMLAGAIESIKEHGVNMLSIVSGPSETIGNRRTIVIRLEMKDATALVRELEEKGYKVSAMSEKTKEGG
jgi:acetoin utilization protein AcuB